jgi:DNA-directed RNA polymerase subunit RPC12/RpoP
LSSCLVRCAAKCLLNRPPVYSRPRLLLKHLMSTPCAPYATTQAALRAASNPAPPRARSTIQRARNLGINTSLFTPPSSTSSPLNPLGLITDSNVDCGDGHGHGWGRGRCYGRASTCAGCTHTPRRARAGWRQQRDREAQPAAAECAPQYECLRCSSALLPTPTPVHSTPTLVDSTLRWIRCPTCAQSTAPSPRASHRAPAHGTPLAPAPLPHRALAALELGATGLGLPTPSPCAHPHDHLRPSTRWPRSRSAPTAPRRPVPD